MLFFWSLRFFLHDNCFPNETESCILRALGQIPPSRVLVKTGLTRHDGRKWIWVAPELWAPLTSIGPALPTCPTCCCRKKWNWDPNKFSMAMCYFELYIKLEKKTIKLGESPLFNKMYTFSQKMWQSICANVLYHPLFTHFLTRRSRIGGQNLIFLWI